MALNFRIQRQTYWYRTKFFGLDKRAFLKLTQQSVQCSKLVLKYVQFDYVVAQC